MDPKIFNDLLVILAAGFAAGWASPCSSVNALLLQKAGATAVVSEEVEASSALLGLLETMSEKMNATMA